MCKRLDLVCWIMLCCSSFGCGNTDDQQVSTNQANKELKGTEVRTTDQVGKQSRSIVALEFSGDAATTDPGSDYFSAKFYRLNADETGISFIHRWTPPPAYERLLERSFAGGGVAIGDYDGDGRSDVYLSRPFGGGRLYRNLGEFKFEDVTEAAGLSQDESWGTGCTFVDINNDGALDLYVCCYDFPNRLYVNQRNGSFREEAASRGLAIRGLLLTKKFTPARAIYRRMAPLYSFLNRRSARFMQLTYGGLTASSALTVLRIPLVVTLLFLCPSRCWIKKHAIEHRMEYSHTLSAVEEVQST